LILGQRVKPRIAYFVHGSDGLGDTYQAKPKGQKSPKSAPDFLIEKVAEFPGEVTVVALGPLTNIALVSHHFYHTRVFSVSGHFM
jgi:uridine nucleosidase